MSERIPLGSLLFRESYVKEDTGYLGFADQTFQRLKKAETLEQLEEILFALKMPDVDPLSSIPVLEQVFVELIDPKSILANAAKDGGLLSLLVPGPADTTLFMRGIRERLGRIALDVFFEGVIDRDKDTFWKHLSRIKNACILDVYPVPGSDSREMGVRLIPRSLCAHLRYLALCNEKTKGGYKTKIRKFLKLVLDEPLTVHLEHPSHTERIGISGWTSQAREDLAHALVANGLYEECIDYSIPEAYSWLGAKLSGYLSDGNDGLQAPLPSHERHGGHELEYAKILERVRGKDAGHLLSVLIRLGLEQRRIKAGAAFDATHRPAYQAQVALLWRGPLPFFLEN